MELSDLIFPTFVRASREWAKEQEENERVSSEIEVKQKSLLQLVIEANGQLGRVPQRVPAERGNTNNDTYDKNSSYKVRDHFNKDNETNYMNKQESQCERVLVTHTAWTPPTYLLDVCFNEHFISAYYKLHGITCSRLEITNEETHHTSHVSNRDDEHYNKHYNNIHREQTFKKEFNNWNINANYDKVTENELHCHLCSIPPPLLRLHDLHLPLNILNNLEKVFQRRKRKFYSPETKRANVYHHYSNDNYKLFKQTEAATFTGIQSCALPSALMGDHVMLCGPASCGKTTALIFSMACNLLSTQNLYIKENTNNTSNNNNNNNNNIAICESGSYHESNEEMSLIKEQRNDNNGVEEPYTNQHTLTNQTTEMQNCTSAEIAPHGLIVVPSFQHLVHVARWLSEVFGIDAFAFYTFTRNSYALERFELRMSKAASANDMELNVMPTTNTSVHENRNSSSTSMYNDYNNNYNYVTTTTTTTISEPSVEELLSLVHGTGYEEQPNANPFVMQQPTASPEDAKCEEEQQECDSQRWKEKDSGKDRRRKRRGNDDERKRYRSRSKHKSHEERHHSSNRHKKRHEPEESLSSSYSASQEEKEEEQHHHHYNRRHHYSRRDEHEDRHYYHHHHHHYHDDVRRSEQKHYSTNSDNRKSSKHNTDRQVDYERDRRKPHHHHHHHYHHSDSHSHPHSHNYKYIEEKKKYSGANDTNTNTCNYSSNNTSVRHENSNTIVTKEVINKKPGCLSAHVPLLLCTFHAFAEALQLTNYNCALLPLEHVKRVVITQTERLLSLLSSSASVAHTTTPSSLSINQNAEHQGKRDSSSNNNNYKTFNREVDYSAWISFSNAVDVECQYLFTCEKNVKETYEIVKNTILPDAGNRFVMYKQHDETIWLWCELRIEPVSITPTAKPNKYSHNMNTSNSNSNDDRKSRYKGNLRQREGNSLELNDQRYKISSEDIDAAKVAHAATLIIEHLMQMTEMNECKIDSVANDSKNKVEKMKSLQEYSKVDVTAFTEPASLVASLPKIVLFTSTRREQQLLLDQLPRVLRESGHLHMKATLLRVTNDLCSVFAAQSAEIAIVTDVQLADDKVRGLLMQYAHSISANNMKCTWITENVNHEPESNSNVCNILASILCIHFSLPRNVIYSGEPEQITEVMEFRLRSLLTRVHDTSIHLFPAIDYFSSNCNNNNNNNTCRGKIKTFLLMAEHHMRGALGARVKEALHKYVNKEVEEADNNNDREEQS